MQQPRPSTAYRTQGRRSYSQHAAAYTYDAKGSKLSSTERLG